MTSLQTLGAEAQQPAFSPPGLPTQLRTGSFLANDSIQFAFKIPLPSSSLAWWISRARPLSKLERLKRQQFTVEGKTERVARSLAALSQPQPIRLSPQEWRSVAEDPDLENQF